MSSQHRPRQRRGGSSHHSSAWSEWEWNPAYNCLSRHRRSSGAEAVDGYEWQYRAADEPRTTTELCHEEGEIQLEETAEEEDNYTHGPSLADPRQQTRSSYHATPAVAPGMADITDSMQSLSTNSVIRGANSRPFEKFDKSYKIHKEYEFKQFRAFKVLWSEPNGGNDNDGSHNTISVRDTRNGPVHAKVRRFVIINPMKGHCLCLPINTYLKQGTMKNGVHAEVHTIVHTTKEPKYLAGEWEKGMTKGAIRIEPATPRDKLEPQSRLNYAKVYTVECNVKVCFIGKVHVDFRQQIVADYNSVHPQLKYGGSGGGNQSSTFSTDAVSHAGGAWATSYDPSDHASGFESGRGGAEYSLQGVDPLGMSVTYQADDFQRRHTDAIEEEASPAPGDDEQFATGSGFGQHLQPEDGEHEDLYSAK